MNSDHDSGPVRRTGGRRHRGQQVPAPASPEELREADRQLELRQAILAVVDQAPEDMPQAVRTAVLAEALVHRELFATEWCADCQATAEGLCHDHDLGVDQIDEFRRRAYRRLPGSPEVMV